MTVKQFTSIVPFDGASQVACNPAGTACVWASDESPTYSTDEIVGCLGGYTSGVFQCTPGTGTCLTCGNDMNFGYVQMTPSNVTKGQPHFEYSAGGYLFLWVSANQTFSGTNCAAPTPGDGKCGDLWYATFSTNASPPYLALGSTPVNITNIASGNVNGVLFGRTGGVSGGTNYLFMSFRFGGPGPSHSCQDGEWTARIWHYTLPLGPTTLIEYTSALAPDFPVGTCAYMEASGFFDAPSGEFTFQGVMTGTSYFWQSNIYAFNLATLANPIATPDTVVSWGSDYDDWNEHASTDTSNSFIIWSSSHGATAGNYNGNPSSHCFGPGSGCTGNLPLDKWAAPICRYANGAGTLGLCAIGNAWQLTGVNVIGSPDRAAICAAYTSTCSPPMHPTVAFSGGYGNYSLSNSLVESIKDPQGIGAIYSIQFETFTSRLLGQAALSGRAKLQ